MISPTARVLIVDDHPLMREALAAQISAQSDMTVCGEAAGAEEASALAKAADPDLAIVDIALDEGNGIELIKRLRNWSRRIRILVISAYEEAIYAERALRAGAQGYINKRECQGQIVVAMRTVLAGELFLSPSMTRRMLGAAIAGEARLAEDVTTALSDRELEVFRLLGHGLTTRAIANRLDLSVHTIETYRANLRRKLNLRNGAELTQRAVQWVLEHA
jgi:DNA-binding NarL/FixJ family response regulator